MGLSDIREEAEVMTSAAARAAGRYPLVQAFKAADAAVSEPLQEMFSSVSSAVTDREKTNLTIAAGNGQLDKDQVSFTGFGFTASQLESFAERLKNQDGKTMQAVIRDIMFNQLMNDLEKLNKLREDIERLDAEIEELDKQLAAKYGPDWQDAVRAKYLDEETIARKPGESDEDYDQRMWDELAKKLAAGEIDDPILAERLTTMLKRRELQRQEKLLAEKAQKQFVERQAGMDTLQLRLDNLRDIREGLETIRELPPEQQLNATKALYWENGEDPAEFGVPEEASVDPITGEVEALDIDAQQATLGAEAEGFNAEVSDMLLENEQIQERLSLVSENDATRDEEFDGVVKPTVVAFKLEN